jgi:hypothetical protein
VLTKLNNQSLKRPEHVLFSRIRNEIYFLPHFLPHYRQLGIEHFYFFDDQSDDGTREYLLSQEDCTVVVADFRLSDTIDGIQAKLTILRDVPQRFIGDGWILFVDADEFLLLPEEYRTISDLARDLDARGEISCIGAMVDFYPETLAGRAADRSIAPFKAFPFFDVGPYFIWNPGTVKPFPLYAGVRHRVNDWMFRLGGETRPPPGPPMLHKVPFLRWGRGMVPVNAHRTTLPPYTGTQVALAHFKFYPDLDAKIDDALRSDFYVRASHHYRLLKEHLPKLDRRSLISLTTRRFTEPKDLREAALLFANGRPF